MQIQGQAALVTGGASGLGEATARALAAQGAKVAVLDRNAELAEQVAADIGQELGNGCAVACPCDITDPASVQAAIDKAAAAHGPARILMNVAGIGSAIRGMSGQALEAQAALVLVAVVLMVVGLAFKVSAVPFHMWAPDAYGGAPTPATGYMAVAVKSAAFAVLVRVLLVAFGDERLASWGSGWPPVVATLAILSMFVANFIAG